MPETIIQIAIPIVDTITRGRRLNRFNNPAFNNDITKRVTPTKIDALNASISIPISYRKYIQQQPNRETLIKLL